MFAMRLRSKPVSYSPTGVARAEWPIRSTRKDLQNRVSGPATWRPEPKCKWGRPEGRPHSHRRVGLFRRKGTWRPVSLPSGSNLAIGPVLRPVSSGSVTGARTGIRFRRAVGPNPKILSVHPAVPRPVFRDGPLPPILHRPAEAFRCQPLAKRREKPADGCVASRSCLVALL